MKQTESRLMNELHRLGYSYESAWTLLPTLLTLSRLSAKHRKLAEMECNGEGWISGKFYTLSGDIKKNQASGYIGESETIFSAKSDEVEAKITALCDKHGLRAEFQGDPRGCTFKIFNVNGQFVEVEK